jgi:glutamate-1-semialdehyde 2,1-aminomutase
MRRDGDRIAAVIIEPVPANNGLLLQRPEFLATLRRETQRTGALLIFDEVISGFRLARGGAAERFGITPDLATFGKVIGGGLPVGAFGGRRELMRHLAPEGAVYQAGTLSGNAVAMAAGLATLDVLERDDVWSRLEQSGQALASLLEPVLAAASLPVTLVRIGSLFWLSLQPGEPPRSAEAIDATAAVRYRALFHALLEQGVALAPSAYEVGFVSLAHEHADFEKLRDALAAALEAAVAAK